MRYKYKVLLLIIGIFAVIISLIITSYAYWLLTRSQTNSNVVATKCLDISISGETNDILLSDSYPKTDEEGMNSVPYTFTITNNCSSAIDYQIALESIGSNTNRLTASFLKAVLDDNEPKALEEYETVNPTQDNAYASYKLGMGTLSASGEEGSSRTYNLRIWIDDFAPVSENGKTYEGKITVTIGQGIETPKLICSAVDNTTVTTGNIPNGKYSHGDEYICNVDGTNSYHFFVLEDGDNTTLEKGVTGTAGAGEVALIMNQNIGDIVDWCSDPSRCRNHTELVLCEDEYCSNLDEELITPITATEYLIDQTSSWLVSSTLPSRLQLYKVNSSNDLTSTPWLYDYLAGTEHAVYGLGGYWTSTPKAHYSKGYYVNNKGNLIAMCDTCVEFIDFDDPVVTGYGVRPVITINKSQIN